jgi:hypothetical protein
LEPCVTSSSGPVKAYLEVEDGSQINCLFNPSEYRLQQTNTWKEAGAGGQAAKKRSFSGGQSASVTFDLLFDSAIEGKSADYYVGQLVDLMAVKAEYKGNVATGPEGRPPKVTLHWGALHSFPGVVSELDGTYTRFTPAGTPLRAKVKLTLVQLSPGNDLLGRQNPTSGTPFPDTAHRMAPAERIESVAAKAYGDPTEWRRVAAANHIEDPLVIPAGMLLRVPHPRLPGSEGNAPRSGPQGAPGA